MIKKKYKQVLIVLLSISIAVVVIIAIRNIAFQSCPLSNNITLDDLQEMDIQVEYIEDSKSWTSEVYDSFCDDQIAGSKKCSCVLIGVPTGNIYFNRGTILQELYVEQVIKGECKYEKIWLQNGLLSTLTYDEDSIILKGMDRSFMQEDCKYLLFCDPIATNEYSEKKVYTEADAMWFGCYNLTRDCDIVMEENQNEYNSEIEFYTSSEKTVSYYNEAKRKLIEMYNPKLQL